MSCYTICAIAVLIAACSFVAADPLGEAIRANDAREQFIRGYRLVWEKVETRTLSPVDPRTTVDEYRQLEEQLVRRGVKDTDASRQQLRRQMTQEVVGRRTTSITRWELEWGDRFLRVSGEIPLQTGGFQTYVWYLGNDWGLEFISTVSGKGAKSLPGPVAYPHPQIWCCSGAECFRFMVPSGTLEMLPEEVALLASLNPLRGGGASGWQLARSNPEQVVMSCAYKWNDDLATLEVVLLPKRGWVAQSVVTSRFQKTGDQATYRVRSFRRVGDYWIPAEIEAQWTGKVLSWKRTWRLKSISPRRAVSLKEITDALAARGDRGVLDYRIAGCNLTIGQRLDATRDGVRVAYEWQGRLPTLEELRGVHSKQHGRGGAKPGTAWYRFVPPVLLILIGVLWYWRLRVRKGA